jgi:hypothetical protein
MRWGRSANLTFCHDKSRGRGRLKAIPTGSRTGEYGLPQGDLFGMLVVVLAGRAQKDTHEHPVVAPNLDGVLPLPSKASVTVEQLLRIRERWD